MANKRIQKKRAKARMLRDKSKVIASMIVMLDADKPRYEQLKIFKMLWKMSLEELLDLSERVIRAWVSYHSPLLRSMRPYTPVDWSSAVVCRPTISNVRER